MNRLMLAVLLFVSSAACAGELDELYAEVVSAEMFVISYPGLREEVLESNVVPPRIDAAIAIASDAVQRARAASRAQLNRSYFEFCASLDPSRSAEVLATEVDAITRASLDERQSNMRSILRNAGFREADREIFDHLVLATTRLRIRFAESELAALPKAQRDAPQFVNTLESGCRSNIESYTNGTQQLDSGSQPSFTATKEE